MKDYRSFLVTDFQPSTDTVRILRGRKPKRVSLQTLFEGLRSMYVPEETLLQADSNSYTIRKALTGQELVQVRVEGTLVKEGVAYTRDGNILTFSDILLAGSWIYLDFIPITYAPAIHDAILSSANNTIIAPFVLKTIAKVYYDGTLLRQNTAYTVSNNTITFSDTLLVGSWIHIENF